jgi:molybdopterin synthase catalytic subunit
VDECKPLIDGTIRKRWNVVRVALIVRLGAMREGELSLIIAVSANRWRDAIDAAQYASAEIKVGADTRSR